MERKEFKYKSRDSHFMQYKNYNKRYRDPDPMLTEEDFFSEFNYDKRKQKQFDYEKE
jgi:hypothetical protein